MMMISSSPVGVMMRCWMKQARFRSFCNLRGQGNRLHYSSFMHCLKHLECAISCPIMKPSTIVFFLGLAALASAGDPSGGWLSYAEYKAPPTSKITFINMSWVVPEHPERSFGSNAPGWWFGVQTADGNGALIQPILAWEYQGASFSIFNAVFDWNDQSWHPFDYQKVLPGEQIVSSLTYKADDNSYDMFIGVSGDSKRDLHNNYKIERAQGSATESTAYIVLEHQPSSCKAYPPSGNVTFADIHVEVDGKPVVAQWQAQQENPACNSKAAVIDGSTVSISWSSTSDQLATPHVSNEKWGFGSNVESKGSLKCSMCEAAVTAVQHALENSTRIDNALENFLESQVCTRLPTSVQQLCNSTVADQLPEILASLADKYLDGPTDCTKLHVCSSSSATTAALKSGSIGCDICELVTGYVNSTIFTANSTVTFLQKELDFICNLLPSEYATVCASAAQVFCALPASLMPFSRYLFLQIAAPEFLSFLGNWIATNACVEIKLCPAPAPPPSRRYSLH